MNTTARSYELANAMARPYDLETKLEDTIAASYDFASTTGYKCIWDLMREQVRRWCHTDASVCVEIGDIAGLGI